MLYAMIVIIVLLMICTEVGRDMIREAYLTVKYDRRVRKARRDVIEIAEEICRRSSDKD